MGCWSGAGVVGGGAGADGFQWTIAVPVDRLDAAAGGLHLDAHGHIAEASGENIFMVKKGRVITPLDAASVARLGLVRSFQISAVFRQLSVRDNLLFAHPTASQEELERATSLARIHEVIAALPAGYDTVVGVFARKPAMLPNV